MLNKFGHQVFKSEKNIHFQSLKSLKLIFVNLLASFFLMVISLTLPPQGIARGEENGIKPPQDSFVRARAEALKKFPNLNNKITIDLKGISTTNILNFLAKKGKLNIVTHGTVTGKVSLLLKDVTILQALDIIVKSNKLAYEVTDSAIVIMTEPEYADLHGKNFFDNREMKVIQLKYASSSDISSILDVLKSSIGTLIIDHSTGIIIIIDLPEKIETMEKIIKEIERPSIVRDFPTMTRIFHLEYANIEKIVSVVNSVLTPKVGAIQTDIRTNTLIITDLPAKMEEIERMISAFDEKSPQVLIKAKIVSVRLGDDFNMGIKWDALFKKADDLQVVAGIASESNSIFSISGGTTTSDAFNTVFGFLKKIGDTKILSTPHIVASNNEMASIMVGTREAYVESTTTTSGTGTSPTTTAESIQFIDVGVKLTVTPTINRKGFIKLKIKPEVSSVVSRLITKNGTEVPIVETSEAETILTVKDGVTVIIGGLIKDDKVETEEKVPFLGDIPLLGWLFKNKSTSTIKREVVVFITPQIITGEEDILSLVKTKELKLGFQEDTKESMGSEEKKIKPLKEL